MLEDGPLLISVLRDAQVSLSAIPERIYRCDFTTDGLSSTTIGQS